MKWVHAGPAQPDQVDAPRPGRSRRSLEAENLALRHQLNVLHRRAPKRPVLRDFDRLLFVCLYRIAPRILDTFTIVKPETVLRWHRAGFRCFWRWKSRWRPGRPSITPEIRRLIRQMSLANPLWGAPRILGEAPQARHRYRPDLRCEVHGTAKAPSIARLENVPPKSCRRDCLDRPVRGSDDLISAAIRIARSWTRPAANYVAWRHRASLSLSEIRPGRNDGAIRRGSAAGECYLSPGQTSLAVSLGQRQMCPSAVVILLVRAQHMTQMPLAEHDHMIEALASDRADQVVQRNRSATAIVALSVCRECPSRECGA